MSVDIATRFIRFKKNPNLERFRMLEQIRKDTLEYVKNLAIGQIQNVLESQKSLAINDIEAFGKETQTQIQDVIDNTTAQMQSIAEQFLSLQTAIEGQFTEALKRINDFIGRVK